MTKKKVPHVEGLSRKDFTNILDTSEFSMDLYGSIGNLAVKTSHVSLGDVDLGSTFVFTCNCMFSIVLDRSLTYPWSRVTIRDSLFSFNALWNPQYGSSSIGCL